MNCKMTSIVQLFVIAAAIATVCGQTFPVTSSSRDYMLISQRDLLHEIEIVELEIGTVNARYADRLDVIQSQQEQLLKEILLTNRTLVPLQALSLVRKQCIQKYDTQLVTHDNAKYRMKLCYDKATYISATLTTNALSNVNSAKNEVVYTLPSNAGSCDRSYPTNNTLLQQCYVKYVDSATFNVNYYLTSARNHLDRSSYDIGIASRTAVQCSFVVEKETLETMGRITETIDNCEYALNKPKTVEVFNIAGPKTAQNLIMGKITGQ